MVRQQQYAFQEQDQSASTLLSLNDLTLVPFVPMGDEWILSDDFLAGLFQRVVNDGLMSVVFWDGGIKSLDDFISFCKAPKNVVTLAFKKNDCVGFAWLNSLTANYAFGHFCFFRQVWGHTDDFARLYVRYWFAFQGEDGPLLDTIIGMVPGFNERAHKFVERAGFKRLGVIPGMLKSNRGDRENAVIFYLSRQDYGEK